MLGGFDNGDQSACRNVSGGGVTAVTCGVSEFTSELTFKLCDELGLPKYCTWDAWAVARNKRTFKDLCLKHGVAVAKDYCIKDACDSEQIEDVEYPVVVKPVDCGGNCGVSFCYDAFELASAFSLAREVSCCKDTIICEQMLQGDEFAAVYALAQGKASLVNLFSMFYQNGAPSNCYSLDVTTSGVLSQFLSEVDAGLRAVFEDAGFTDGIAWVEFIYDSGMFYALETGYRLPGGMLPHTFQAVASFNAIDWYIDTFLGIPHLPAELPAPQTREYEKYGVSYLLWNSSPGVVKRVSSIDTIANDPRYEVVDFIRRPGFELPPYSLMGEVIFTANSKEEVVELVSHVNDVVNVVIDDGEDVLVRFTDFEKIR